MNSNIALKYVASLEKLLIFSIIKIIISKMVRAVWFLINVLIDLLFIFVIIYQNQVVVGVLTDINLLSCLQSIDLLVDILYFKLIEIRWLSKIIAFCFDLFIYRVLIMNKYLVFNAKVWKYLIIVNL